MRSFEAGQQTAIPLGVGYYTVPEAARLLKIPALNIRRWLGGYAYGGGDKRRNMPPLWTPQLPSNDSHIELGFRDLIELRFVQRFLEAGVGLQTVRYCLEYAKECVSDERPFSTSRFQTDGRTIFLEGVRRSGDSELLDLKRGQYAFKQVIERSFKDLDIENDAVARWRPFHGKQSIIVDPARAFGQPIASHAGVPTITLAQAAEVESSLSRVAFLYDVTVSVVRDAVQFEKELLAA